jgi:hypothetical protein
MFQKPLLTALCLALLGAGCGTPSEQETTQAQAANAQLVKQWVAAFNQRNWATMATLYADSLSVKDPAFTNKTRTQSKQNYLNQYRTLQQAYPNATLRITQLYLAGTHQVIVETVALRTAPGSVPLSRPSCTIFTIEHGKISRQ